MMTRLIFAKYASPISLIVFLFLGVAQSAIGEDSNSRLLREAQQMERHSQTLEDIARLEIRRAEDRADQEAAMKLRDVEERTNRLTLSIRHDLVQHLRLGHDRATIRREFRFMQPLFRDVSRAIANLDDRMARIDAAHRRLERSQMNFEKMLRERRH